MTEKRGLLEAGVHRDESARVGARAGRGKVVAQDVGNVLAARLVFGIGIARDAVGPDGGAVGQRAFQREAGIHRAGHLDRLQAALGQEAGQRVVIAQGAG